MPTHDETEMNLKLTGGPLAVQNSDALKIFIKKQKLRV